MNRSTQLLMLLLCLATRAEAGAGTLTGARHPALSSDGQRIAFSYQGDIWVVPAAGGRARALTHDRGYDQRPIWTPDDQAIVFTSTRTGHDDVYIVPLKGGDPRRLTEHSASDVATDVSPDGRWALFRSNRSSGAGVFAVSLTGGLPVMLLDHWWSRPYGARFAPDGRSLVLSLGGENRFWWRQGYRGANAARLWRFELASPASLGGAKTTRAPAIVQGRPARRLFDHPSSSFWPAWSSDGQEVFFVSDRRFGAKNLWRVPAQGGEARPITRFKSGVVCWPSAARRAPRLVFERDFGIWLCELKSGRCRPVKISAPAESREPATRYIRNAPPEDVELSPDGKKLAVLVHGELFVMGAEGGYARNLTNNSWRERQPHWLPDSRHLVVVSDRDSNRELYLLDALGKEPARRLTHSEAGEFLPRAAPKGGAIAYLRGKRELRLIEQDGSGDRLLVKADLGGRFGERPQWSPDGRFIAITVNRNGSQDILALELASGRLHALTNSAYDERAPAWSADGKSLYFLANRFGHSFPEFTGKWDIYRLGLRPAPLEFAESDFEKLFTPPAKPKIGPAEPSSGRAKRGPKGHPKPPRVVLELRDLKRQTSMMTRSLGSEQRFVATARRLFFVSNLDGGNRLWAAKFRKDKLGRPAPFAGLGDVQSLCLDRKGRRLYYRLGNGIGRVDLASGKATAVRFETRITEDRIGAFRQRLGEIYETLRENFYDGPRLKRVGWSALYRRLSEVLPQITEERDFFDAVNLMIGRLNASHSGARPRSQGGAVSEPWTAHFGAAFEQQDRGLVLTKIYRKGPLWRYRKALGAGDRLESIDGKPLGAGENIWRRLRGKVGRRILLGIRGSGGKRREFPVRGITARDEGRLRYAAWVRSRRSIVEKQSGGRLAYIHMAAMGSGDLKRFILELERDAAPRQGLILDLRYNNGGNVHDRVIQALCKPVYARWRIRGMSSERQSTFGMADKPLIVLVNERTLSDGEMTASGLKSLKRGVLVGQTTYGWLIFTTGVRLLGGGGFRLPFWGCYTLDGRDLETMGGVQPDVRVPFDINDERRERDPQLAKALELLMRRLPW